MKALFKHLIEITCHRDHHLLDSAVVSALHELIGASQARVLELLPLRGNVFVHPRVWIKEGKAVSAEENADIAQTDKPISHYPALEACIKQHQPRAEETTANGDRLLWLPVWINDKVSTCLEITNFPPCAHDTLYVMEGILSVYRNYQNLLDYSERDSLTGLLNRKTFDEKFSRMVSSAMISSHTPVENTERRHLTDNKEQWLAVIDIDHFKRINDQFGHLYGDEVLILIANLLRSAFRTYDRVFRFGGEEFVILLRSAALADAHKIFERFRSKVEQYEFPQLLGRVTVSVGFAGIKPGETPVVTLGHADQSLYYAKTNGRNRVCHYDELVLNGSLHSEVPNDTVEFFFDNSAPS